MVELNGDTAGNNLDNYDQLQVTGTVTLGNTLTVSIGNAFTPIADQQFKIIDNDGSDPVSGTFKDLPEGSSADGGTQCPADQLRGRRLATTSC